MSKKTGYSWSLDISTTNVGMALWYESGDLVELKHLELKVDRSIPEDERYLHKAKLLKEFIITYKTRVRELYGAEIDKVFVEAPLSNTPVNINTTAKLLAFNGIACYMLDEIFGKPPYLISVYQSRKLFCPELVKITKKRNGQIKETLSFGKDVDKKHYIWNKVSELEPQIDWFYTRTGKLKGSSYDMSDAYCVGVAGLKVLQIIT
jgi:hypothetical protein